jgi:anti-sigma factor RsiW
VEVTGMAPSGDEIELACRELVELVTDYLDGTLDPATAAAVERHLRECDACAEYLDQMRATIAATEHLPVESLSEQTRADILAAFRALRSR